MVDDEKRSMTSLRKITFKVLKATIKGLLFCTLYYVCWLFLAPFAGMIPGLQQTVETFAVIYIALVIIGEITAGTVYHYFFSIAKALFVICYLILSLNSGIMNISYQNLALQVDIRLFLVIAMMLGLVGLSKSVLQTINFVSQKAENTQT
jgi:hypothetical protein